MLEYLANMERDGSDCNHIFDLIKIEKQAITAAKVA